MKKKFLTITLLLGVLIFSANSSKALAHHNPHHHMHKPPVHHHIHRPPIHHHNYYPRHSIYYSPYYYSAYRPGINLIFDNDAHPYPHGHFGASFNIRL